MALYVCKKCGMSFTSKCAKTRSIFEHTLPSGERVPLAWDVIVGEIESKETDLYTEVVNDPDWRWAGFNVEKFPSVVFALENLLAARPPIVEYTIHTCEQ